MNECDNAFQAFVAICLLLIVLHLYTSKKSYFEPKPDLQLGPNSSGATLRLAGERTDTGASAFVGDGQHEQPSFWNVGDLQTQRYGAGGLVESAADGMKASIEEQVVEGFNQYDLFDGSGAPRTNAQQQIAREIAPVYARQ